MVHTDLNFDFTKQQFEKLYSIFVTQKLEKKINMN